MNWNFPVWQPFSLPMATKGIFFSFFYSSYVAWKRCLNLIKLLLRRKKSTKLKTHKNENWKHRKYVLLYKVLLNYKMIHSWWGQKLLLHTNFPFLPLTSSLCPFSLFYFWTERFFPIFQKDKVSSLISTSVNTAWRLFWRMKNWGIQEMALEMLLWIFVGL